MQISIEIPDSITPLVQVQLQNEQTTLNNLAAATSTQFGAPSPQKSRAAATLLSIVFVLFMIFMISRLNRAQERSQRVELSNRLTRAAENAQIRLTNYLLSGADYNLQHLSSDQGEVLHDIEKLRALSSTSASRQAVDVLSETDKRWYGFAQSMIQKRQQVDAGNSTVAEMQIFYLNQDPEQISLSLDEALARVLQTQSE